MKKKYPGYLRCKRIMELDHKNPNPSGKTKYTREQDMKKRVLAVMAMADSSSPLSLLRGVHFKKYLKELDPLHQSPHHLECSRILEVLIDAAMMEVSKIVTEQRKLLRRGYVSLTSDFVTDATRRSSFGLIMIDMVTTQYELLDGQRLFMSEETTESIETELMLVSVFGLFISFRKDYDLQDDILFTAKRMSQGS